MRIVIIFIVLIISGCTSESVDYSCITALDCAENEICQNGECVQRSIGDTGDTGDTGNTGNSGDTGNTGDTGDSGNTGNTGNTGDTGVGTDTDGMDDKDLIEDEDGTEDEDVWDDIDTVFDMDGTDDLNDIDIENDENETDDSDEAGDVCVPETYTFEYTGAEQTFTVPSGTTNVQIEVWGAQGGSYITAGGLGGYAKGTLTVTSGQMLSVYVGGQGSSSTSASVVAGGFNGGGYAYGFDGNVYGASGGGASDVRTGGIALTNRVIVAGGGGYYGGGSGSALGAAGGGGSGYTGGVTSGSMQNGVRTGNGEVKVTRTCP